MGTFVLSSPQPTYELSINPLFRRQRSSKHTLIDFSFALAVPERHRETPHLFTRIGDSKDEGQMLMKMMARSGEYALCVRYKCAGIGVDTEKWHLSLVDEEERARR